MAKKRVEEDFKKASATLGEEGATRALSGGRISTNGLPSSFPSDVPEPRGGKVTGSVDGSKDVKTAGWVAFTTSDSMSDAANYYVTKMTANGWERVNSMDTTEARSLVFKKNSNTVSITINNGTPTTVMITYASE